MLATDDPIAVVPVDTEFSPPLQDDLRPVRKVLWAIPDEGYTQTEALANIRLVAFHLGVLEERSKYDRTMPRWEFSIYQIGRLLTPLAREYAAKAAVATGSEYLLMTDNDGLFPVDLFERLQAHNVDIVAPLAFTRNDPYLPVIYCREEGFDSGTGQPYSLTRYISKYPKNALVECDAVGFHAVLIRVALLKQMKEPIFFNLSQTGEDIYFCIRAKKEHGARIFCDTSISTGHLTRPSIVDEDFAKRYWKDGLHLDAEKDLGSSSPYQAIPLAAGGKPYELGHVITEATQTPHSQLQTVAR